MGPSLRRSPGPPSAAALVALLAVLGALAAVAQDAPRPPTGIPGLRVEPPSSLTVLAGQSASATFHVAYTGNATHVQFRVAPFFPGGPGGPGTAGEAGGPGGHVNGTRGPGPRNGTRPGNGTFRPDDGTFRARGPAGNVSFTVDPRETDLAADDAGNVTVTATARPGAPAMTFTAFFVVSQGSGRNASRSLTPFTVIVGVVPTDMPAVETSHRAPAAEGLVGLGAAVALAWRRR